MVACVGRGANNVLVAEPTTVLEQAILASTQLLVVVEMDAKSRKRIQWRLCDKQQPADFGDDGPSNCLDLKCVAGLGVHPLQ